MITIYHSVANFLYGGAHVPKLINKLVESRESYCNEKMVQFILTHRVDGRESQFT